MTKIVKERITMDYLYKRLDGLRLDPVQKNTLEILLDFAYIIGKFEGKKEVK